MYRDGLRPDHSPQWLRTPAARAAPIRSSCSRPRSVPPNRPGPLHVRWTDRAGELLEHAGSKRTAGGGLFWSGRATFGGLILSERSRQAGQCLSNPQGVRCLPGKPSAIVRTRFRAASRRHRRTRELSTGAVVLISSVNGRLRSKLLGASPLWACAPAPRPIGTTCLPGQTTKGRGRGNEIDGYSSDR